MSKHIVLHIYTAHRKAMTQFWDQKHHTILPTFARHSNRYFTFFSKFLTATELQLLQLTVNALLLWTSLFFVWITRTHTSVIFVSM